MKYMVLADIHGNLEAFEAVIDSFPDGEEFRVVCAGDVVGYGADPNRCIEVISSLNAVSVLGNHDAATIDKADISFFNESAKVVVLWTRENIDAEGAEYLNTLPFVHEGDHFTMVHGTLHSPEKFIYMFTPADAMHTFEVLEKNICFIGHSHVPGVFAMKDGNLSEVCKMKFLCDGDAGYIINVGSVGQPRDGNWRACYCIYDDEKNEVEFKRVEYDVKAAQKKMIDAGLPEKQAERLSWGR